MNKQELIKEVKEIGIYGLNIFGTVVEGVPTKTAIELIKQLDEPEKGHADEAPRYVKNILARLRELPLHDREVWLKAIMGEFEQDFSHAKWREGYEQGKFDGSWVGNQLKDADKIRCELNKEKVPQFVADWYEENKDDFEGNLFRCIYNITSIFDGAKLNEFEKWFLVASTKSFQTLVNMHQFGYEVEEEKRYLVKMPNANFYDSIQILSFKKNSFFWSSNWEGYKVHHTRKELEEAGFGWVFNCEGIEVEEVEG